jgi:hypothetical protein
VRLIVVRLQRYHLEKDHWWLYKFIFAPILADFRKLFAEKVAVPENASYLQYLQCTLIGLADLWAARKSSYKFYLNPKYSEGPVGTGYNSWRPMLIYPWSWKPSKPMTRALEDSALCPNGLGGLLGSSELKILLNFQMVMEILWTAHSKSILKLSWSPSGQLIIARWVSDSTF